ncbi:MAG: aminoglycoside phosphotransferase family protein [Clostridiales bacterium]|nr:aminoglycoside phosphotransferase family protein [Clostridiales bacterium]
MITKNRQSDSVIREMIRKAFPEKAVSSIKELTEGMCNVTYAITFTDGEECILKIAAKDTTGNTSNEICLMAAEVSAMELVRKNCTFKVADVFAYDRSRTICDGDYFFMEKLPGTNYSFIKEEMPDEVKCDIAREIGEISKQLCTITNPQFGFLGDEKRYDHLSDFVHTMLSNLVSDGQKKNVDLGCDADQLLDEFEKEKHIFDEVSSATLVHWDMWEGNVFVKDNHVSGIIDWERAMWGEAFMDDRFRSHNRNPDFLEGFGKQEFTENELKRLRWYDIILYLTMMIEVFYREFEDKGQYFWSKEQFLRVLKAPTEEEQET